MTLKLGFQRVRIEHIAIPRDHRTHLHGSVARMAESMATIGQIAPITLRLDGTLVAGRCRIDGAKANGDKEIEAIVRDYSDPQAVLVMHYENMRRSQYNVLEESRALAECKQAYEELYPQTKAGVAGGKASGKARTPANLAVVQQEGGNTEPPSFSQAAAESLDRSERSVQRVVAIGENLSTAAEAVIKDMPVADNQRQLEALAALPKSKQIEVAKAIQSGEADSVKEAVAMLTEPEPDVAASVLLAKNTEKIKPTHEQLVTLAAMPEKQQNAIMKAVDGGKTLSQAMKAGRAAKPSKNGTPTVDSRLFKDFEQKVGIVIRMNSAVKQHCGGADHHETIRGHLNAVVKEIAAWRQSALKA